MKKVKIKAGSFEHDGWLNAKPIPEEEVKEKSAPQMKINLFCGDSLEVLKGISDNCIDSVVCDPPYGLSKEPDMMEVLNHWMNGDDYKHTGGGFMGKKWDSFVPGPAIWRECMRVLKPGGHLLAFFGSRTYDMGALAIRLAGFEIRDQIMWVYGSGFPKSLNVEKATQNADWAGWGTALKPAHEPICVARKPLAGTVADNVLAYGTGGMNIDGCRVEGRERTDYGLANSSRSQGSTYSAPSESADFDSTKGRWPANLVHDGSEEVMAEFPQTAASKASMRGVGLTGNVDKVYGKGDPAFNTMRGVNDNGGSAARYFYCAKSSKEDRNYGLAGDNFSSEELVSRLQDSAGMQNPRAGAGRTSGSKNPHPTVKPIALMEWLVRLVTPFHGIVLDPFMGSGSTGIASVKNGLRFVGIELDENFHSIASQRINFAADESNEV